MSPLVGHLFGQRALAVFIHPRIHAGALLLGFGLAIVVAGAALFVRYSMSKFLRFWLVRLVHEQRAETDRLIAAIQASRDVHVEP